MRLNLINTLTIKFVPLYDESNQFIIRRYLNEIKSRATEVI